jgi:ribosomal protein S18 acetylase RimI-like enzyme
MPELEIQPFSDEHLDIAAELLAARHERHLEAEPLLPSNPDFRAEVEAVWQGDHAAGVVALRGSDVVGYLLGVRRDEAIWGLNIWIEYAGHAVVEPELLRDLYAVAAADWVQEGRTRHYALVPATDPELVDAWFRVSFGAQHAAGIQETPEVLGVAPGHIEVRRAEPSDLDAAIAMGAVLADHQRRSPVFGGHPMPTDAELRAEIIEELADPQMATFIAERNGQPMASLVMVPAEKSSMHTGLARPEHAALLAFAATFPEARGSGAGLALTSAGLAWAKEEGYPVVLTDWRETNLLSSRFWPNRGFRRTFLRLYRSIP